MGTATLPKDWTYANTWILNVFLEGKWRVLRTDLSLRQASIKLDE